MSDLAAYTIGFAAGATALAFGLTALGYEVIHRSEVEPADDEMGLRLARAMREHVAGVEPGKPPLQFKDKRALPEKPW